MTTKVEKSVLVNVPVSVAYNQWTQFEDFPHFMGGVTKVTQLSDDRLEWVAEIAGRQAPVGGEGPRAGPRPAACPGPRPRARPTPAR